MLKILHLLYGVILFALFAFLSSITDISAQAPAAKLANASLILSPEFCETSIKKGSFISGKETFEIGKEVCPQMEKTLQTVFSGLTRASKESEAGSAQLVLIPKFVDLGATKTATAFSDRELVILLEWTIKDAAGKPVWVETVQGSGKEHTGNVFTAGKNRKKLVAEAVKDLVDSSAKKMSEAAELRKFAK